MIGDMLQMPLILTHAQTKSDYTLKKFWPSKFANDPQIFKQGVINYPQNSGLAETLCYYIVFDIIFNVIYCVFVYIALRLKCCVN